MYIYQDKYSDLIQDPSSFKFIIKLRFFDQIFRGKQIKKTTLSMSFTILSEFNLGNCHHAMS